MRLPAFVCLSVSKITQNMCMDLDEMFRVDRCRDMDELINFWVDPDYSPDAGTGLLSPLSYKHCNAEFYYVEKIQRIRIARPSLQWGVVLQWFYSLRAVGTAFSEVHALCRVPF